MSRKTSDSEWDVFSALLPSRPTTAGDAYDQLAAISPGLARAAESPLARKYGLVEAADGEWPRLRLFRRPELMAKRLGELEGTDCVVWAFIGQHLPITRGPYPHRNIRLPEQAMQIPRVGLEPRTVGLADIETLSIQEDGFLGPIELAEAVDDGPREKPEKP